MIKNKQDYFDQELEDMRKGKDRLFKLAEFAGGTHDGPIRWQIPAKYSCRSQK